MKGKHKRSAPPDPQADHQQPPILDFLGAIKAAYAHPAGVGVDARRGRLITSLYAAADLIDLSDLDGKTGKSAGELRALALALGDLKRGAQTPLLRLSSGKGRRADEAAVWMIRADVVIGAEFFSAVRWRGGQNASAVARFIAEKYPKLKKLLRKNINLKSCMKHWRKVLDTKSAALGRAQSIAPFPVEVASHFRAGMAIAHYFCERPKASQEHGIACLRDAVRAAELLKEI